MKILGLIPARGGSKGIPKKNIKKLGGKELIRYSIEVGLAVSAINTLIVSTDDEDIASISKEAGATIPFMRPSDLATDSSPSIDTVLHALDFFDKKNIVFDAVCLLQATTPFRAAADIAKAIQLFKEKGADSLISVREVPHHYNPHWVFEKDKHSPYLKIATGEKEIISRRQALPKAYHRDGALYLTKSEVLREKKSLYGEKILPCILENSAQINIDTMEDWTAATTYLNTI